MPLLTVNRDEEQGRRALNEATDYLRPYNVTVKFELQQTLADLQAAVISVGLEVTPEPTPLIKAANVQPQFDKLRDGADYLIAMIRLCRAACKTRPCAAFNLWSNLPMPMCAQNMMQSIMVPILRTYAIRQKARATPS